MGTAQVTFVVVVLPEVILCTSATGSNVTYPVLRMHNRFPRFFLTIRSPPVALSVMRNGTTTIVVPLRMTDRATGGDRMSRYPRRDSIGYAHAQPEVGVPALFSCVFGYVV